jgi:hypothetical protein
MLWRLLACALGLLICATSGVMGDDGARRSGGKHPTFSKGSGEARMMLAQSRGPVCTTFHNGTPVRCPSGQTCCRVKRELAPNTGYKCCHRGETCSFEAGCRPPAAKLPLCSECLEKLNACQTDCEKKHGGVAGAVLACYRKCSSCTALVDCRPAGFQSNPQIRVGSRFDRLRSAL